MGDIYIEYPKEEWHVVFKSGRIIRCLVDSVTQLIHFKSLTDNLDGIERIYQKKRKLDNQMLLAC